MKEPAFRGFYTVKSRKVRIFEQIIDRSQHPLVCRISCNGFLPDVGTSLIFQSSKQLVCQESFVYFIIYGGEQYGLF